MTQIQEHRLKLAVGTGRGARELAVLRRAGSAPGLFWLGGFNSTMDGAKATALDRLGKAHGIAVTRFDYSGCGETGGDFATGTISRWLEEAEAVFAEVTEGPQVVVGSSMGAWLALLLQNRLRELGDERVRALVLIAPAVDMTEALMRRSFSEAEQQALERVGQVLRPSAYGDPLIITRALIEDGVQHCLLGKPVRTRCPVHIIHGALDPDVPREHAFRLMSHLLQDEASFTLVPDGDHRLSRDEDLRQIERIVLAARAG